MNRLQFWWRYLRKRTPWDTGITPPEIVALAERLTPGRSLDLGCGTGTNVLYLAERGWRAVGVDFVPAAIWQARAKAREARYSKQQAQFHVGDVTRLTFLSSVFDLVTDVGCLHALDSEGQRAYASRVAALTRPEALYALYAFLPHVRNGRPFGLTPEQVAELFAPDFTVVSTTLGTDTTNGGGSAWYELKREWPPTFG